MELVPYKTAPRFVQACLGILKAPKPFCSHGAAFGSIGHLLVEAVEAFHRRLRAVASRAVYVHCEFFVPYGQLGVALVRQEIFEQLVGGGAHYADASLFALILSVDGALDCGHRLDGRRAAGIAGAVIVERYVVGVAPGVLQEHGRVGQVFRIKAGGVVEGVCRNHYPAAVQGTPEAEFKRHFAIRPGQVALAPLKLLGGESYESAVGGYGGQLEPEAEAVGKENVGAQGAEFLLIEVLPQEYVAGERLGRWNIGVGGLPAASAYVPAPPRNDVPQPRIRLGVVFFHPRVLDSALTVEYVVGEPVYEHQVTV